MQVSIETAYLEACQAIGEEVVKGRLMSKALAQYEQKESETRNLEDILAESGATMEEVDPKDIPPHLQEELAKRLEIARSDGLQHVGANRKAKVIDDQDHKQGGLSQDI